MVKARTTNHQPDFLSTSISRSRIIQCINVVSLCISERAVGLLGVAVHALDYLARCDVAACYQSIPRLPIASDRRICVAIVTRSIISIDYETVIINHYSCLPSKLSLTPPEPLLPTTNSLSLFCHHPTKVPATAAHYKGLTGLEWRNMFSFHVTMTLCRQLFHRLVVTLHYLSAPVYVCMCVYLRLRLQLGEVDGWDIA